MSAVASAGAVPIPFISQDSRNPLHFTIDPAAAKLLSSIKGKICPVVIAGPYRSGKSMLLNMLLPPSAASSGRRPGFAVGSTVQACTKGIWLWGEPIHVAETGKTILFLDSEGMGSIGQQATFDVQIFSLAILLSSLFLLNTHGNINENALEQLELVVQMTERVRVREAKQPAAAAKRGAAASPSSSSSSSEELSLLAAHFPDWLWILRDFSLQLEDASGSPITPRQYLEQALQPVRGSGRAAEKNRIRQVLSTVFPRRDLVPLVRPVAEEKKLQQLDRVPERELRPEFIAQIGRLRQRVYDEVREKSVEGVFVTGPAYVALAESYVRAINAGGIPVIHSAWSSVVELQGREGVEEATRILQEHLRQATASLLSRDELMQAVVRARAEAMRALTDVAVGDAAQLDKLRQQVESKAQQAIDQAVELNAVRCREHNAAAWKEAWRKAGGDQLLSSAEEGKQWTELEAKVSRDYQKAAKGEGKDEVAALLLGEKREQLVLRVMERRAEERKEAGRLRAEKEVAEKRAAEAEKELSRLQVELQYERESRQSDARRAEQDRKRDEERSRAVEAQLKEADRAEKRLKKEHDAELEDVRSKHRHAEAELRRLQDQLERERAQWAKEKESMARDRQQAEQQSVERHRRELQDAQREAELSKRTLDELRERLRRAEAERDKLAEEVREVKGREKGAKATADKLRAKEDAVVELQRELAQARKDREFYIESSRRESEAAEEAKDERRRLERQRQQLQDELSRVKAQHDEEDARNNEQLEERLKRLAAREKENEQLQAELQQLRRSSAGAVLGKRRREDDELKDDDGMDTDDATHDSQAAELDEDIDGPQHRPSSAAAVPPRGSLPAGLAARRSLAPTRSSLAGSELNMSTEPVDPTTLSVAQLKSWLTELDVDIPQRPAKKAFYVDMIYKALPELQHFFPQHSMPADKHRGAKAK